MSFSFDPHHRLIIVRAELEGPSRNAVLRLALDTGATRTLVNESPLIALGYDLSQVSDRFRVTTGSGIEFVPRISVKRITALGQERSDFPVLCHTLPPGIGVDGLLGLDFFRGRRLTLDFRSGRITIN